MASKASAFTPPSSDLYLRPALYDWHYENSPDSPLFVFVDDNEEPPRRCVISCCEGLQAAQRATDFVRAAASSPASSTAANGDAPHAAPGPARLKVFAILSAGDTLPYFVLMLGVLRTGYAVFPVSLRLPPPVVAALLAQARATHSVLSADEGTQEVGRAAVEALKGSVQVLQMPAFKTLFPTNGVLPPSEFKFIPFDPAVALTPEALAAPSLILHSTGMTGTPKAVPWTTRQLAQGIRIPPMGDVNVAGAVVRCHAIPMFAAMGSINLFAAPSRGMVLAFFAPAGGFDEMETKAPPAPDPVNLMKVARRCGCDYLLCVPAFLEIWARDKETVEVMKGMWGFLWGGGPLAKDAGDALTAAGIKLYSTYGSTEAGLLCRYISTVPGADWEYFAFAPNRDVRFFPTGDTGGDSKSLAATYEVAVVQSTEHDYDPCITNTFADDKPAYLLPDLFTPHPTRKELWRILGRADDTIALSTGTKVHPTPLEGALVGGEIGPDSYTKDASGFRVSIATWDPVSSATSFISKSTPPLLPFALEKKKDAK